MDKQNEGIQDLEEASDPGRHERLVTVEEFGRQEGLHKGNTNDVLFFAPKFIRNGLFEVTSYPKNSTLKI